MPRKVIFISAIILAIAIFWTKYEETKSISELKKIEQWAEENKIKVDKSIEVEKFKIEFDQKEWNLLKQKLSLTRYFTALEDVPSFDYGFDPDYARELVEYWQTNFDWKSQVDYLNKYPQFRIRINDTLIHYVHYITNPNAAKKVNLLLLDGWPGAFFGFFQAIEFIQKTYTDISFSIVVPSIPGYHFSTPLNKKHNPVDTSLIFDGLMRFILGEKTRYFIHGEDWGSIIASSMSQLNPDRVLGLHITMPTSSESNVINNICTLLLPYFPGFFLSDQEIKLDFSSRYSIKSKLLKFWHEFGYFHLQATRPDTLGHALTDSPAGLMAYILEKYSSWTFRRTDQISGVKDGGLKNFKKDDLLTICTLYWMTNSITSSMRYYANSVSAMLEYREKNLDLFNLPISEKIPVAVQMNINDIFVTPFWFVKTRYQGLIRYNIFEDGGHFAAFQNPQTTAEDLIDFVNQVQSKL
ncbi:epoxide hydrolase 1 [Brachionus plicatilis]|uniref:Epoxide hydrolase n=1 Tax=Brachionus plicatilis TaxID=10195 RepID=A0A3M7QUS3_BRAPC|nr:epoxide hydrolase 1 [Brachionus plicatilis]